MALINHAKREINAKIVYVGPNLSGKTTILQHIYRKLKPEFRGKIKSMNLQNDKMMFFDFQPAQQRELDGYRVKFHVYTLVGNVSQSSSWKMVIKGADGVVFVADSSSNRVIANVECFQNLKEILCSYSLNDIPIVLQCNKRDLPDVLPLEDMSLTLTGEATPVFPSIASKGEGVLEGIFSLTKNILNHITIGMPGVQRDIKDVKTESYAQEEVMGQNLSRLDADLLILQQANVGLDVSQVSNPLNREEMSIDQPAGFSIVGRPDVHTTGNTSQFTFMIKIEDKTVKVDLTINLSEVT